MCNHNCYYEISLEKISRVTNGWIIESDCKRTFYSNEDLSQFLDKYNQGKMKECGICGDIKTE